VASALHRLIWRAAEPWRTARQGTPQIRPGDVPRARAAACAFGELAGYRLNGDLEGELMLCEGHGARIKSIARRGFSFFWDQLRAELNASSVNVSLDAGGKFETREMRWTPSNSSFIEMG
jgi:hypothetical protein